MTCPSNLEPKICESTEATVLEHPISVKNPVAGTLHARYCMEHLYAKKWSTPSHYDIASNHLELIDAHELMP